MTKTVLDICTSAARSLGVVGFGDVLDGAEADNALERLQGLFNHLVAVQTFGPLYDVLQSGAYTAKEQERITGASSVVLPSTIADGCVSGGFRSPKDRSVVVVSGATPATHLYDADLADWVSINDLTLASPCPLSSRFDRGLSALLALEMAADYGSTVTQAVADAALRGKRAMTRKDGFRPRDVAGPLLHTSNRRCEWVAE